MTNTVGHRIQWHPPFYTALQVELEMENLDFTDEYCVRKLPCRMDVLITKHDKNHKIDKNIGQIFKKYNLVEYKPPGDYLSIDDYFYMQGNAGLLKSGGQHRNDIQHDEVSVTFVCYGYPRKLMCFLKIDRHLRITEKFPGIYYIEGEIFPTQIIVTRMLNPADNLWLSSLRKHLDVQQQNHIVHEYEKHRDDRKYEELTSFIATINIESFRRRKDMCKGLMEIVRPEIEAEKSKAIEEMRPLIAKEAVEEARPGILLEAARGLLDCLDAETIAQKLGLPVEAVRRLGSR